MNTFNPAHTRPFNVEHAKAGAPFCGSNGEKVRPLIFDRKHPTHPIIVIQARGDEEITVALRVDGTTGSGYDWIINKLVMLPLGFIDGKPVFTGDELVGPSGPCAAHSRVDFAGGKWSWPAPRPDYPESLMRSAALDNTYCDIQTESRGSHADGLKAVADAAIRHAIDSGQVAIVVQP